MTWFVATDDYPPLDGGVATWAQSVASGLEAAGERVVVLARRRPGAERGEGPPLIQVRGPSFGRRGGVWMAAALAWRLRPGNRVLATTWTVATHLVGPCRAAGAELHVVYHGSDLTRPARSEAQFQRVASGAAHRWCVSQFLTRELGARGHEGRALPSPVNLREPSPNDSGRWVMVARATPLKGGERFLRLAHAAAVRAEVVGDGPALDSWRDEAARLGLDARFHGRLSRDAVADVVRGAGACFLLPQTRPDGSGAEGLGLTLLEGAALGVPGVGCEVGGVPEAVGPHGLVLEDPDDVEGSVEAIRAWWTPGRGAEARGWLEAHHGVERCVEGLMGPAGD